MTRVMPSVLVVSEGGLHHGLTSMAKACRAVDAGVGEVAWFLGATRVLCIRRINRTRYLFLYQEIELSQTTRRPTASLRRTDRSVPVQAACGLVFRDSGFKEVFLFCQIHRFAHPRKRILRFILLGQSDAF